MNRARLKASSGGLAWIGLAAFVATYDTWALSQEGTTLSSAFKRSVDHRSWRWLVGIMWIVTTLHLFGLVPRKCDPYHGYGVLLAKVKNR